MFRIWTANHYIRKFSVIGTLNWQLYSQNSILLIVWITLHTGDIMVAASKHCMKSTKWAQMDSCRVELLSNRGSIESKICKICSQAQVYLQVNIQPKTVKSVLYSSLTRQVYNKRSLFERILLRILKAAVGVRCLPLNTSHMPNTPLIAGNSFSSNSKTQKIWAITYLRVISICKVVNKASKVVWFTRL